MGPFCSTAQELSIPKRCALHHSELQSFVLNSLDKSLYRLQKKVVSSGNSFLAVLSNKSETRDTARDKLGKAKLKFEGRVIKISVFNFGEKNTPDGSVVVVGAFGASFKEAGQKR